MEERDAEEREEKCKQTDTEREKETQGGEREGEPEIKRNKR